MARIDREAVHNEQQRLLLEASRRAARMRGIPLPSPQTPNQQRIEQNRRDAIANMVPDHVTAPGDLGVGPGLQRLVPPPPAPRPPNTFMPTGPSFQRPPSGPILPPEPIVSRPGPPITLPAPPQVPLSPPVNVPPIPIPRSGVTPIIPAVPPPPAAMAIQNPGSSIRQSLIGDILRGSGLGFVAEIGNALFPGGTPTPPQPNPSVLPSGVVGPAVGSAINLFGLPGGGGGVPGADTGGGTGDPAALALALSGRRGGRKTIDLLLALRPDLLAALAQQPIVYQNASGGQILRASPGSVIVRRTIGGQPQVFQMNKELAIRLGFYKTRRKPVLTAGEVNAVRKAARVKKRVRKIGTEVDLHVYGEARARPEHRESHTHRHTHR